ncbi:unnamed protein product [Anisakis simplex]|uniref:MARVEL domain-containing protein n=1 Tax=Anisakis simplex TaxID=6269 RepID=A0A0M3KEL9_ANISI|nr:unnamed protein product [Anisakis simplex]
MLLCSFLKLPPTRNHSKPQYFTCCGRIHVKEALLMIVIGTLSWDVLRWANFVLQKHVTADWLEIFTEAFDALFGILLLVAYLSESGPLLLPYLFMQLLTLIVSLVLYFICTTTIFWIDSPWAVHFQHGDEPNAVDTRLRAFLYSLFVAAFSLILIWVIRVILASYRFFDEKSMCRSQQRRDHAVIFNNKTNGCVVQPTSRGQFTSRNDLMTSISLDKHSNNQRLRIYTNENFTLSDEDAEDEREDQLWPQPMIHNNAGIISCSSHSNFHDDSGDMSDDINTDRNLNNVPLAL